jgi:hypothetical protein
MLASTLIGATASAEMGSGIFTVANRVFTKRGHTIREMSFSGPNREQAAQRILKAANSKNAYIRKTPGALLLRHFGNFLNLGLVTVRVKDLPKDRLDRLGWLADGLNDPNITEDIWVE